MDTIFGLGNTKVWAASNTDPTLFDINFTPRNMSVSELQSGFLKLVEQLYSAEETQTRRRNFKRRLRTSPNFKHSTKSGPRLLAA